MNIVKKNLMSIVFGVIALLAIAAVVFYPVPGMYDGLRTDLQSSITIGKQMETLLHPQPERKMPQTSPDTEVLESLKVFPTPAVIEAGMAATTKINQQSKDMQKTAEEVNSKHVPLVANSLPKPSATVIYEFAVQYVKQTTDGARWRQMLNAGVRPLPADIEDAKKKKKDEINSHVTDTESQQEADALYAEQELLVKPRLELDRARKMMVYLDPEALNFDPSIGTGAGHDMLQITPARIWDAQVYLWVIDDVAEAIRRANDLYCDGAVAGGTPVKDVLHTPIKQIERIDNPVFTKSENPADLTTGVNSSVALSPQVSAMGHVSNALFDVYQFNVVLDVDAAKVPQVLRELEVGQFITILNLQVTSVDTAMAAYDGFIYGNKPVVKLEIQCEELFMHEWTDNLIPDSRKGGAEEGSGPGGPGGPHGWGPGGPNTPAGPGIHPPGGFH